jgi:hypothetical protein
MDTHTSRLLDSLTEEEWSANLDSLPYGKLTKVFSDLEVQYSKLPETNLTAKPLFS